MGNARRRRPWRRLARPVRLALRRLGYDVVPATGRFPRDFGPEDVDLYRQVAPYTMTTPDAIYTLAAAVRHVVADGIPGSIVECGVWRGGSMMTVAKTLLSLGRIDIDLYLFDTFEGMAQPGEEDVCWTGEAARDLLAREPRSDDSVLWAQAGMERVRTALISTGYPASRLHFVAGKVEDTLPREAPEQISLLRLDTDWYASTRHELDHLYPRLERGGVLILDDYGWWRGAGQATDEYFREHAPAPLLVRVDDGGCRLAVKT